MGGYAWVTLATNNSYSLGALVLAHSLKKSNTAHKLVVLITSAVSESMRNQLSTVFDIVKLVDVLDSKDEAHLALMQRPELGITFTKIHCWRLVEFEKCVFLDADTLVVKNCDELFEREEFSAAPDASWPDCFNSGVFVFRPSIETFNKILQFAVENKSFDGGDQGLLNQFFSSWATEDIKKHLPFVYNLTSIGAYAYIPAFKHYGAETRIVHFIGTGKPWLQQLNIATKTVTPSVGYEHLAPLLQQWWDLFCEKVHPNLDKNLESSSEGMSHSPVEACSNSLPIALTDETQTLRLKPCTPHEENVVTKHHSPFVANDSSGVSPKSFSITPQSRSETKKISETRSSETSWNKDISWIQRAPKKVLERVKECIKTPEKIEERVNEEEWVKEPQEEPPPKDPFDFESFFPDETCIKSYLDQNVMTYQPFDNQNEIQTPKEPEPLPRFLTIPEDDRRQSGNVDSPVEKHEEIQPVAEKEVKIPDKKEEPPKETLTKSKSMSHLPFEVTTELPQLPRSIWKSQPNVNVDPNKKYSMPRLKPILPKQSSKFVLTKIPKVTHYTEFLMSSEYKDPVNLPKDRIGFVATQIHTQRHKRNKPNGTTRTKFGPLPFISSPEMEKPACKKIRLEHSDDDLYDLTQCKRQSGNKPKPKEIQKKQTGNNVEEILKRLKEFSKDYQHYFGIIPKPKRRMVICRNATVQASGEGECRTSGTFKTVRTAVCSWSRGTQTISQRGEFRLFRNYIKDQNEASQKGLCIISGRKVTKDTTKFTKEEKEKLTNDDIIRVDINSGFCDYNGGLRKIESRSLKHSLRDEEFLVQSKVQSSLVEENQKPNHSDEITAAEKLPDFSRNSVNVNHLHSSLIVQENQKKNHSDNVIKNIDVFHSSCDGILESTEVQSIHSSCSKPFENSKNKSESVVKVDNDITKAEANGVLLNLEHSYVDGVVESLKVKVPHCEEFVKNVDDSSTKPKNNDISKLPNLNSVEYSINFAEKEAVNEEKLQKNLDDITIPQYLNPQKPDGVSVESLKVNNLDSELKEKLVINSENQLVAEENQVDDVMTARKNHNLFECPVVDTVRKSSVHSENQSSLGKKDKQEENIANTTARHNGFSLKLEQSQDEVSTDPSSIPNQHSKDEPVAHSDSISEQNQNVNDVTNDFSSKSSDNSIYFDHSSSILEHNERTNSTNDVIKSQSLDKSVLCDENQTLDDDVRSSRESTKPKSSFNVLAQTRQRQDEVKAKKPEEILCVPDFETPRSSRVTVKTTEEVMTSQKPRKSISSPKKVHERFREKHSPDESVRFAGKKNYLSGSDEPKPVEEEHKDTSGIAGAIAQLSLQAGSQETPESTAASAAHQEYLRRQNWETGNIDYMGRDSFDNIWSKICQTLESKEQEPAASAGEVKKLSETLPDSEFIETLPGKPAPGPVEDDEIIFSKADCRQPGLTNISEEEEVGGEGVKLSDILGVGDGKASDVKTVVSGDKIDSFVPTSLQPAAAEIKADPKSAVKEIPVDFEGKVQFSESSDDASRVKPDDKQSEIKSEAAVKGVKPQPAATESKSQPPPPAETKPQSSVTETKSQTLAPAETKPQTPAPGETKPQPTATETKPQSPAPAETKPQPPAPAETKPQPPAPAETKPQPPALAETKPQPPAPAETKPQPPAPVETKPQPPAPAETKPQPPALAETKPQPPALAETKPQPPAPGETKPQPTATETKSQPPGLAKTKPQPSAPAETKPQPPAPGETKPQPTATEIKSQPLASGETYPQPPAPAETKPQAPATEATSKSVLSPAEIKTQLPIAATEATPELNSSDSTATATTEPTGECKVVAIPSPSILPPKTHLKGKKPQERPQVHSEPIPLPAPDSPSSEQPLKTSRSDSLKDDGKQKKGVFTKILEMVGVKDKNGNEGTKSVFYDSEGNEVEGAKDSKESQLETKGVETVQPIQKPERSGSKDAQQSIQMSETKRKSPSPKLTMPQTPQTAVTTPTPPPTEEIPPRKNSALLKVDETILETPPVPEPSSIQTEIEDIIGKAKTEVETLLQDQAEKEATDVINTMKLIMGEEQEEVEELKVTSEEERKRHKGEVVSSKLSDQILKAIPPPRRKAISDATASTSAIPKATPEQKSPQTGEGKTKSSKPSSIPVPPPRNHNKGKPQPSPSKGKGKK